MPLTDLVPDAPRPPDAAASQNLTISSSSYNIGPHCLEIDVQGGKNSSFWKAKGWKYNAPVRSHARAPTRTHSLAVPHLAPMSHRRAAGAPLRPPAIALTESLLPMCLPQLWKEQPCNRTHFTVVNRVWHKLDGFAGVTKYKLGTQ